MSVQPVPTPTNRRPATILLGLAVAVLLLALGLRLYRLDGQSFWYDEGTSVLLAGRDLPTIARDAAADIHPPLYYFLLHYWTAAFGTSEIAARSLSVVLGVLLVAVTWLLGRRLFDGWTALAALEAHRDTPHYEIWRGVADVLEGPTEPTRCKAVFPAARSYWGKV